MEEDWYTYLKDKPVVGRLLVGFSPILIGPVGEYIALKYSSSSLPEFWIGVISSAILALFGSVELVLSLDEKKSGTLAYGSNALRYIAHNSTYEAPQLRAPEVPVIDDEFKNADQQVYQEQVRELTASQEVVGIKNLVWKERKYNIIYFIV